MLNKRFVWGLISLVLVVGLTKPTQAQPVNDGQQTVATLRAAVIPARDDVDLGQRLLGIHDLPQPPATPEALSIGAVKQFSLTNLEENKPLNISAQLLYITPHVYMWFEVGFQPDLALVKRSADAFERNIYPIVHRYIGTEALPGIDNDKHLYIVHAQNLGSSVAAYFDPTSELPRAIAPTSNEHQMFVVNLDTMATRLGSTYYESVLAHEFQHMVHANLDSNEAGWLDEGLSELAASLAVPQGFSTSFADAFLSQPATQLNRWNDIVSSSANYGASYLFTRYFLERFGEKALHSLVNNPKDGLEGVLDTLQTIRATDASTGQPVTLVDFFADWVVTNLVNNSQVGDGRFAYQSQGVPDVEPTMQVATDTPSQLTVSQWGTTYLKIAQVGKYSLSFTGQPTVPVIPVKDGEQGFFWWSNRGDKIDTRLTHAFDLTQVSAATLEFRAWYDIEQEWDYGHIYISTDDGASWTALRVPNGTTDTTNNNPYGAGFTGKIEMWANYAADLSTYAGKQILLRFEMLTDAAINHDGWAVDDIRIPEINYSTDAASDDGWIAEGWARIENVLPQAYLVQQVSYGPAIHVTRRLGPADGITGQWQFVIRSPEQYVVLAISGLTEFTTQMAQVSYSLLPVQ